MDELSFRRTIYAEPHITDPDIIKAAKNDPAKQAFWDDVKAMDAQLAQSMQIPVPENFADKLILRQDMDEFTQIRRKRPWYVGLAASVAIVVGVSYMTLLAGNNGLANDVFAHVGHEYMNKEITMSRQNLTQEAINEKMAFFNVTLSEDIGKVVSANYCYLKTIKSLHMIIRGETGFVNLFVVTDDKSKELEKDFSQEGLIGTSFLSNSVKIIIVGDDKKEISQLKLNAKNAFRF
jgi:hypothetical protein